MFRFTIRDVLWLMVVVAFAVCWYLASERATTQAEQWTAKKERWDAERAKKDDLMARQSKQYFDMIKLSKESSARIDGQWRAKMKQLTSPVPPPPPKLYDPDDPFAPPPPPDSN